LEHGNQFDINKKITFKIKLNDDYIRICVKDEGTGIDYCSNSYFNNDIYVRGRGLFIVSKLADELKIRENCVEAKLLVKPN
ncbi:MAG: ATP-binding protein, partial [Staphylococcus epidermidis]|nr:ATP-binding protein [Staphylococcus epidermidis]